MHSAPDERAAWRNLLDLSPNATALEVCRSFELMARAIAPLDLGDLPFYAQPTSALPEQFAMTCNHCLGWYSDWLHIELKPYLENYQGPGPACIVRDSISDAAAEQIARAAQTVYAVEGDSVSLDELLECVDRRRTLEQLCGTLTHELAHALQHIKSGSFAETSDLFTADQTARFVERDVQSQQKADPPPTQLACHGLEFTRIVAHLDCRLRAAGVHSRHLHAAGSEFYQRPYDECYAALQDELAKCAGKSFSEILSMPMPSAFVACAIGHVEGASHAA